MVWKDYQHPLAVVGASEIDAIISKRRQKWWKIIPKSYFSPTCGRKIKKLHLDGQKEDVQVLSVPRLVFHAQGLSFHINYVHRYHTLYDYLWIRQGRRGGRGRSCRARCVIRYWLRCVRWNCDTAPRLAGSTRWVDVDEAAKRGWRRLTFRMSAEPRLPLLFKISGWERVQTKISVGWTPAYSCTWKWFFFFSPVMSWGGCFLEATHHTS